jgi:hypothetical protein
MTFAARWALVAACGAAAIALAGCGGDGDGDAGAEALGEVRVGSVAQLAQCSDWNSGTEEEKLATLDDVKEQINLRDGTGETPEIPDDAAIELLDNSCEPEFAAGFRLYKIYARATGFASFAGE